jgi:hypothetical protein
MKYFILISLTILTIFNLFIVHESDALSKCQEKYAYDTCVEMLG